MTDKVKFKIGERVVYPGHGVGQVSNVLTKKIAGLEQKFYELALEDKGVKVMVPLRQVESVGVRKIVNKKEVAKVYSILSARKVKIDNQTWNRRFRQYTDKLKTGSVYEIAEVLRDLTILENDKELSFGEKKMRENACNLLASEISIAKSSTKDKVLDEILGLCS